MNRNEGAWKAINRVKAKKKKKLSEKTPSEAERLFFLFFPETSHWEAPSILLPFNPTTYLPYFKQDALAILSTGIIGENGLKGHEDKEFFPINQRDQRDLIIALIDTDFRYRDITFYPGDILKNFDFYVNNIAVLAKLAGITDSKINKVRQNHLQKWKDKISQAVSKGNFPSNWHELLKCELITSWNYRPKSQAQAFAIIFLEYAPEASDKGIAIWANTSLKSLGRPTASNSRLRKYIQQERKLRPWLPQKPSKNHL